MIHASVLWSIPSSITNNYCSCRLSKNEFSLRVHTNKHQYFIFLLNIDQKNNNKFSDVNTKDVQEKNISRMKG